MDFDILARLRYCRAMLYRYPLRSTKRLGYELYHPYYLGQLNALLRVAVALGLGDQARAIANATEDEARAWGEAG